MNTPWKCLAKAAFALAFACAAVQLTITRAGAAPDHVPGRVLVQFAPGATAQGIKGAVSAQSAQDGGEIGHTRFHIISLKPGADETAMIAAFSRRHDVTAVELDQVKSPQALPGVTPNDPKYTYQWGLSQISAPTAWTTTTGSSSIVIAIIDTGCDPTHPDLQSKYVPGWNFYDNNSDTSDTYIHGTGTAGIAAACSNNGIGVAGVSWGAKIMPLKISDPTGYATLSAAANALTWAADHGARVADISYMFTNSAVVTTAAQYFQSKGGVVVLPIGNYATNDPSPDNPSVITVSATDQSDHLATWSNTGSNVDICAPGVNIYETSPGGKYGAGSGTCASTALVAGTAALVLSVNPNLTGAEVRSILLQSADDLGPAGWDPSFGWGRVNAARAVSMAGGPPPADTVAPTVSFTSPGSGSTVSGTVNVQASASDNVGVASVSFYLDGTLASTTTSAPYSYSWNSSSAGNGSHTLKATAMDAAGNSSSATVTVTVSNSSVDTTPPNISIISPSSGSNVSGSISVTVNAADNVGVTKVEFYVDGKLKASSTSAPFTIAWNVRKLPQGSHTIYSRAYDAAGNSGSSPTVLVYR